MEFQAVVLAAGRGSRMTDLTGSIPKPLLPIANMPMVWYPLQMLQKAGFNEAIVVVLESACDAVRKALVELCDMTLEFVVIADTDDWGSADTLRHIRDRIKTDMLLVSCDLVTDLSLHLLADVHRTYDASLTMLLAPSLDIKELAVPGGKANRKMEKDIIGIDENGSRLLLLSSEADFEETISFKKSFLTRHPLVNIHTQLADAHLYFMKRWVLDLLTQESAICTVKGELVPHLVRKQFTRPKVRKTEQSQNYKTSEDIHVKNEISTLAKEDEFMKQAREMSVWNDHRGDMDGCFHGDGVRCYAYVMNGGFCLRANTLLTYCEANRQVPQQLSSLASEKAIPAIHPSAIISQKSQVGANCIVGDGTAIGERVGVKTSVIGKHCNIGDKVRLTGCVIMDHVTIDEGCTLSGCVVCENAHVGTKCELKDCLIGSSQSVASMTKLTNEILVELDRMMEI